MTATTPAAVFRGPGEPFELRDLALPVPTGAEVLVEVVCCTLCGSDLHSIAGRRFVAVPTILGHEVLGRVAELGPTAGRLDFAGQALRVGDRVTWGVVASCGQCFYCRRALPQKCDRQTKYGHELLRPGRELTGGLAGHCLLVPGTAIFRVPDVLSDAVACPANCATATVAAAIESAGEITDRSVLVMGAGMLGLTAAAWTHALEAEQVIVCDTDSARRGLAERFGATHQASPDTLSSKVMEQTSGHGVDIAFELTGSPDAFETILSLTRQGGIVVLVGSVFPTRAVPIALEQLVRRCLSIRGVHNYAPWHLQSALAFLSAHREYPFPSLVSGWSPLSSLDQVLVGSLAAEPLRLGIRPKE